MIFVSSIAWQVLDVAMKGWSGKVEAPLLMISSLDDLFFVRKAAKIPKRFRKSWLLHTARLIQPKDDEIEK